MCNPASMIVTRSRVLWDKDDDSHETIITRHGLDDSECGGDFVRIEIVPLYYCYRIPVIEWEYRTDQDDVPAWYDEREAEIAVRAELPRWAEHHIISQHGNKLPTVIGRGQSRVVLRGKVVQRGGHCRAYNNVQVEMHGGRCIASDSSQVIIYGGTCFTFDNTRAELHGGNCHANGNSQVIQTGGFCGAGDFANVVQHGGVCKQRHWATVDHRGGELEDHRILADKHHSRRLNSER